MKIQKIIQKLIQPKQIKKIKTDIPPCPIVYDRNNVTAEEFKEYIHWLAENNINRTIYEPDKFITQEQREIKTKHEAELEEYKRFVRNLAQNNINRTFWC